MYQTIDFRNVDGYWYPSLVNILKKYVYLGNVGITECKTMILILVFHNNICTIS